jgi:rhamnosyltransferase
MSARIVEDPVVSIVMVTRNGAATLPEVLDAVEAQDVAFPFEIIAVDSGSTDGSRELLEGRAGTLITIGASDFNHGTTRNLGIERARGALVVLLVQDATPEGRDWLATLTAPFESDPQLAGTFCRQIPRPAASPLTRHYLTRWFANGVQPRRVSFAGSRDMSSLAPLEQLDRCTFDNVCSCIRRSVWQRHRFASTPIAEDLEWAKTVLQQGFALAYIPQAIVVHSHDRGPGYEFGRTYLLHRRLFELFGVRTVPSPGRLLRAIASSMGVHLRCIRQASPTGSVSSLWRGIALAVVWPLGQYLGAMSAARRWTAFRLKGI